MKNKIIFAVGAAALVIIFSMVLIISASFKNVEKETQNDPQGEEVTMSSTAETKAQVEKEPQSTGESAEFKDEITKNSADAKRVDAAKYFGGISDSRVFNNELQTYLISQTSISSNRIRLTAQKLDDIYISGKAESKIAFRYGEFKFRIKTMNGKGLFPAIWLLSKDGVLFPEIDVYEMIGSQPEYIYGVLHYKDGAKQLKHARTFKFKGDVPQYVDLTFKWTRESMIWLIGNEEIFRIDKNVPEIPVYMIINLAVGGNWPGNPDSQTKFPATFDVEILKFSPAEIYSRA